MHSRSFPVCYLPNMEVLRGSRAQGVQLSPTILMILYEEPLCLGCLDMMLLEYGMMLDTR
jgi:hypothetical protein